MMRNSDFKGGPLNQRQIHNARAPLQPGQGGRRAAEPRAEQGQRPVVVLAAKSDQGPEMPPGG